MTYQLALLDNQRHNISEKEIHTWKDHLVGVMSGTAANFPTHLWCQAVPQAELQLLLIRQSNVHPVISAYAYVYGPHDYNAELFVPIRMETLVHNKPRRRKIFAEHCIKGYVLRTSFYHYRACIMRMKKTKTTRISGKVFHKHKYIINPDLTPEDWVIADMDNLSQELKGKSTGTPQQNNATTTNNPG